MAQLAIAPKADTVRKVTRTTPKRTTVKSNLSAVQQVKTAFRRNQRISAVMGFLLGGFIPTAVFTLVHDSRGVASVPALWLLVAGGLGYSAPKVWKWGKQSFGGPMVSAAFVLLLEGTVTFAPIPWLSHVGLAFLIAINGISAAVALQARPE